MAIALNFVLMAGSVIRFKRQEKRVAANRTAFRRGLLALDPMPPRREFQILVDDESGLPNNRDMHGAHLGWVATSSSALTETADRVGSY